MSDLSVGSPVSVDRPLDALPADFRPSFGQDDELEFDSTNNNGRKSFWIGVLALMVVVVGIVGLVGYLVQSGVITAVQTKKVQDSVEQTVTNAEQAMVYKLKGQVLLTQGNVWKMVDGRKIEIKEQDVLVEGDTIISDAGAKLVLIFDDGSTVRLDEQSELVLRSLSPTEMILEEIQGKLYAQVEKDANHLFVVRAGTVDVVSMGTRFAVEKEKDALTKVKVFESKVKVKGDAVNGAEIEVAEQESWDGETVAQMNLAQIEKDDFYAWALQEEVDQIEEKNIVHDEVKKDKIPEEERKLSSVPSTGTITVSAQQTDSGILVKWEIGGFTPEYGFKVIWSEAAGPVYPTRDGDAFHYHTDNNKRSDVITEATEYKTYHIRVCQYLNGTCGVYSNEVTAIAPHVDKQSNDTKTDEGEVKSISLSAEKIEAGKVKVRWTVDGSSELGFKVVWSQNNNPTYPTRDGDEYHYLSESGVREDVIEGLESGKTYHFRVCEYLGGKCGVYSGDVSVGL